MDQTGPPLHLDRSLSHENLYFKPTSIMSLKLREAEGRRSGLSASPTLQPSYERGAGIRRWGRSLASLSPPLQGLCFWPEPPPVCHLVSLARFSEAWDRTLWMLALFMKQKFLPLLQTSVWVLENMANRSPNPITALCLSRGLPSPSSNLHTDGAADQRGGLAFLDPGPSFIFLDWIISRPSLMWNNMIFLGSPSRREE